SFCTSIALAADCSVAATLSTVASCRRFVLARTITGVPPKRSATTRAAPFASLSNTFWSPYSPNARTATFGLNAAPCAADAGAKASNKASNHNARRTRLAEIMAALRIWAFMDSRATLRRIAQTLKGRVGEAHRCTTSPHLSPLCKRGEGEAPPHDMRPLWAARGEDTRRAATTSPRPHRHISAGADVAVAQVRRLLGSEFVLALQARQPVFRVCRHSGIFRCLEVEPVEAGRIACEGQRLSPAAWGREPRGGR